jgi:hypothetical protein
MVVKPEVLHITLEELHGAKVQCRRFSARLLEHGRSDIGPDHPAARYAGCDLQRRIAGAGGHIEHFLVPAKVQGGGKDRRTCREEPQGGVVVARRNGIEGVPDQGAALVVIAERRVHAQVLVPCW